MDATTKGAQAAALQTIASMNEAAREHRVESETAIQQRHEARVGLLKSEHGAEIAQLGILVRSQGLSPGSLLALEQQGKLPEHAQALMVTVRNTGAHDHGKDTPVTSTNHCDKRIYLLDEHATDKMAFVISQDIQALREAGFDPVLSFQPNKGTRVNWRRETVEKLQLMPPLTKDAIEQLCREK